MIYLIGGAPRCGKTTVARLLARRLGCSWVPTDYLESMVYHYLPDADRDILLPLLDGSYDTIYATYSPEEIIENYKRRARTMWPAIQLFLHFALAHEQDFVLEGFHIDPAMMAEFTPSGEQPGEGASSTSAHIKEMLQRGSAYALAHGGDERITASFLYREDTAAILAAMQRSTDKHEWARARTNEASTVHRIAEMVSRYSSYISRESARRGLPAFAMDGDFRSQVGHVVAWLEAPPS